MKKFKVTGLVSDLGKVQHVIKAIDKHAAKKRFHKAYPRRNCTEIMVSKP